MKKTIFLTLALAGLLVAAPLGGHSAALASTPSVISTPGPGPVVTPAPHPIYTHGPIQINKPYVLKVKVKHVKAGYRISWTLPKALRKASIGLSFQKDNLGFGLFVKDGSTSAVVKNSDLKYWMKKSLRGKYDVEVDADRSGVYGVGGTTFTVR